MDAKFAAVVESLQPKLELLLQCPSDHDGRPRGLPEKGVYLFSENGRHLYVGRSNHMRQRYGQHTRPGSQHNQAVFAFKLTCEDRKVERRSYRPGAGSRVGLSLDEEFSAAFVRAKARVRAMSFQFVEETDQTRQTLLELYVAIALGCPYNDFNAH